MIDFTPRLGFITVPERTPEQHDAHAASIGAMVQFALAPVQLAKGEAIRLFDFWKKDDVVKDVGLVFDRIHQLTGSCVWAGGTNAVFTTIATQRMASDSPTKAFLPFTLGNYAMSRHYMGSDRQGEGSMGSTFAKSLTTEGIRDWAKDANLPAYNDQDGISVASSSVEMTWSSIRNPALQAVLDASKPHLFGSAADCGTIPGVRSMLGNGYGVTFACDRFIGHGSVRGTGDEARVMGKWDSNGGHQQSLHGYEEHPDFGPIYLAQNNWPRQVYPILPTQPVCSTWVLEADVEAALRYNAEVYGLSHLSWFPANPKVMHFVVAP